MEVERQGEDRGSRVEGKFNAVTVVQVEIEVEDSGEGKRAGRWGTRLGRESKFEDGEDYVLDVAESRGFSSSSVVSKEPVLGARVRARKMRRTFHLSMRSPRRPDRLSALSPPV